MSKILIFLSLFLFTATTVIAQISGTVFRDFNGNGAKDNSATFNEIGLAGITVKAYAASGVQVGGTQTTNASGAYSFTGLTLPVRVEFTNLSTGDFSGFQGTGSGTSVQFISTASSAVNYGVNYPADYCQTNPQMVTPCYVESNLAGEDIVVKFSYLNEGIAPLDKTVVTQTNDVNALWGLAYERQSRKVYAASVLKAHIPLGTDGLDAIYEIDPHSGTPNATLWLNLYDDLGIQVSSLTTNYQYIDNATRGLNDVAQNDAQAFTDVGTIGIGDIELSEDGKTLYLVNLYDKKLYAIDVATKTLVTSYTIPNPGCTGGVSRPWAIGERKGEIFVGVLCDGSTSGNTGQIADATGVNNLSATVYRLDGTSFTQVLTFPLSYPKEPSFRYAGGCDQINSWKPWYNSLPEVCADGNIGSPTPMFTDIDFADNGDMVLGFTDRTGFQFGFENYGPTGTTLYSMYAGGDVLKACKSTTGWEIESTSGSCQSVDGLAIGVNDVNGYFTSGGTILPKAGEFYEGDFFSNDGTITGGTGWYPGHPEITLGGLTVIPGTGEVMSIAYDPVTGASNFATGGVITLSNTTGKRTRNGFQLYDAQPGGVTAGKGVGFGDLEALCDIAPIEIGNRIWKDTDLDGIQDADELGIDNVEIELLEGGTLIETTTSSNGGQWYFNSSNVAGGLKATTDYTVRVKTPLNTGSLVGCFSYTTKDAATGGVQDMGDSDAETDGTITYRTGNYGENNHTLDIGLTSTRLCIAPTPIAEAASRCGTGTVILTASGCTTGYTATWYSNSDLTTLAPSPNTGDSYTTPSLTTTTDYYVACVETADLTCKSVGVVVKATINPNPTITTGTPVCNEGGTAFEVGYSATALSVVTADKGTPDVLNSKFTNVASGETITITAALNGCEVSTTATIVCVPPCPYPNCTTVTVIKN